MPGVALRLCTVTVLLIAMRPIGAAAEVPLATLAFKATHNSYACLNGCGVFQCTNEPPVMHHPPEKQMDDFGVWALELDFDIVPPCSTNRFPMCVQGPGPRAVVGHSAPNLPGFDPFDHVTCWGSYLTDFFQRIKSARSFTYRPTFLFFDIKDWSGYTPPPTLGCSGDPKWCLAVDEARQVFGPDNVVVDLDPAATISQLAGKVVVGALPPNSWCNHCTAPEQVQAMMDVGCGDDCSVDGGRPPCHIVRLDQYEADWTFQLTVPPNPIVVDVGASTRYQVQDAEGDLSGTGPDLLHGFPETCVLRRTCVLLGQPADTANVCSPTPVTNCVCDFSNGEVVREEGTYRFPYTAISRAVARAEGFVGTTSDPRRVGEGWTILLRPGVYHEAGTLTFPIRLSADPDVSGTVRIGN